MASSLASSENILPGFVRVSTVLKAYSDFSKIPPDILERKCRIGTEVHRAVHAHLDDDLFIPSEEASVYMPAFYSFIKGAEYTPVKVDDTPFLEQRLYSNKLKITGQIDAILQCEGNDCLYDWKTSYTANRPIWRLQVAMYLLLVKDNGLVMPNHGKVVQLKKKGSYRVHDFFVEDKDFDRARAAIDLYWYFNS